MQTLVWIVLCHFAAISQSKKESDQPSSLNCTKCWLLYIRAFSFTLCQRIVLKMKTYQEASDVFPDVYLFMMKETMTLKAVSRLVNQEKLTLMRNNTKSGDNLSQGSKPFEQGGL